jgi:hypothetical protein
MVVWQFQSEMDIALQSPQLQNSSLLPDIENLHVVITNGHTDLGRATIAMMFQNGAKIITSAPTESTCAALLSTLDNDLQVS